MLAVISDDYNALKPLLEKMEITDEHQFGPETIYHAIMDGEELILISTGYGKINMGFSLGYLLSHHKVTIMIGIGNSASLDPNYAPMKTIGIGERYAQWDVDYSAIGYPLTVVPDVGKGTIFANRELVKLAEDMACKCGYPYKQGKTMSADYFVSSNDLAVELRNNFQVDFVDSESAFIAQVAYMCGIQFVSVKGISNHGGDLGANQYALNNNCADIMSANLAYAMLQELICHMCC